MNNKEIMSAGLKLLGLIAFVKGVMYSTRVITFAYTMRIENEHITKYSPGIMMDKLKVLCCVPVLMGIITYVLLKYGDKITDYLIIDDTKFKMGFWELPVLKTLSRLLGVLSIIIGIESFFQELERVMPFETSVIEGVIKIDPYIYLRLLPSAALIGLGIYFMIGAKHLFAYLALEKAK
jgi:hypothetical protein